MDLVNAALDPIRTIPPTGDCFGGMGAVVQLLPASIMTPSSKHWLGTMAHWP